MATLNPTLLRNKGIPVITAKLDEEGQLILDEAGEPETEKRWIRITLNDLADVEERWGSLAEFEAAFEGKVHATVRQLLAILWVEDERLCGERMLAEQFPSYVSAISGAMAIANGVDPTQAARIMEQSERTRRKIIEEATKQLKEVLDEAEELERAVNGNGSDTSGSDSPGLSGSKPGPDSPAMGDSRDNSTLTSGS